MTALPGDPPFNQYNNHYDVASYKRICSEFGIAPLRDFRFTYGENQSGKGLRVRDRRGPVENRL